MRTILIDTSGGLPVAEMERVKGLIRAGDRVIMFDTDPMDRGIMATAQDIENLQWTSGSGALLSRTLELVAMTGGQWPILIFTDGLVADIDASRAVIQRYGLRVEEIHAYAGHSEDWVERMRRELIS